MLLGVPIFDTTLVVLSRLRRKRPVYTAALDHTYHRLLSIGLNSTRAVLIMQVAALLLGCMAFLILTRPPWMANGVFIAVIISGVLAFRYLDDKKRWP
jgi:UDP-N-acetylmuramyl pentapeptide phosphotransferase/UDP-N-acetylglucosamine-1-phosphate transferase